MSKRSRIVLGLAGWLSLSAAVVAQAPPLPGGMPPMAPLPAPYPMPAAPYYGPPPGLNPYMAPPPPAMPPYGPGPDMPPGKVPMPCFAPPPPPPCEVPCEPATAPLPIEPPLRGPLPCFGRLDYCYWWVKKSSIPILLTSGSLDDFQLGQPGTVPGALGQPNTRVLVDQFNNANGHNGLQLTLGLWLDADEVLGIQGSYFALARRTPSFSFGNLNATGTQVIARPFFNAAAGFEDADPVVVPGVIGGGINIANPLSMMGAEANLCYNFVNSSLIGARVSLLLGGRWVALDEKILIDQARITLPDITGTSGPVEAIHEDFSTFNRFYGGQIGGQMDYVLGPLTMQCVVKCGLGVTNEVVRISGATIFQEHGGGLPQATIIAPTALLVQQSNAGRYTRNQFAVVPTCQLNLAYAFNENLSLKGGYDLLIWSEVARPGNQIDRNVTVQPLNSPPIFQPNTLPAFPFNSSALWVQGFHVGFEVSF